jgi:hypothetical protein
MIGPGVRSRLVVLETRSKTYPVRERANRRNRSQRAVDPKKSKWIPDLGGSGHEIVKESQACPGCCTPRELPSSG